MSITQLSDWAWSVNLEYPRWNANHAATAPTQQHGKKQPPQQTLAQNNAQYQYNTVSLVSSQLNFFQIMICM